MNNKGQTLVVFILILPLLLMLGAFIVDNAYMTYKNIELKDITKSIIKTNLTKNELDNNKVQIIYEKNNIPTKELEIIKDNNKMHINNKYYLDSIFGKIIGLKSYEISVSLTGELKDNKVIYK